MASWARRHTWELLLVGVLAAVVFFNVTQSSGYLGVDNFVNMFQLHIEKVIVVVVMTFVIVSGEIDLSVASVMAWAGAVMASLYEHDVPMALAIVAALAAAAGAGLVHGWCVAKLGLPSLVVTLAGLIGWRGAARVLVEDRSVGDFPDWFDRLGQDDLIGPLPFALVLFAVMIAVGGVVLHRSATGRKLYVIGDNAEVARYAGVDVVRARLLLFTTSSLVAGVAGVLFAARLGTVRGDMANGFELEIITIVLLGGVSIFGGTGRMAGVLLAILIVLNLRNGFGLANVGGNVQTGVIGAILIGSVLAQNLIQRLDRRARPAAPLVEAEAAPARADAQPHLIQPPHHRPASPNDAHRHQGGNPMKLTRPTAVLLGIVVLLAAACGDDDDDDDAATDTGAATTAAGGTETTAAATDTTAGDAAGATETTPAGEGGGDFASILLPKCTGIAVFDQANEGATEAATELGVAEAEFVGPASCSDSTGQVEFVTNAVTQGVDAIMISNNAGDQIEPAVQAASEAGIQVVTWDSPIPSGQGESLFVAQVDFDETGQVMADMTTEILGAEGGEIAILSASPDAANQNAWIASFEEVLADPAYDSIELVDTVYGNDDADESYNQALALIDSHPDLRLIMAPTTVGIAAAAKAMQDEGLCDQVKVSGLGLPDEMASYTENGCAPQFALWSFVDLGYVTFYAAHALATGELVAEEGATFTAGRMGDYTLEADPTRDAGLRIVMGPFTVYDETNVG